MTATVAVAGGFAQLHKTLISRSRFHFFTSPSSADSSASQPAEWSNNKKYKTAARPKLNELELIRISVSIDKVKSERATDTNMAIQY